MLGIFRSNLLAICLFIVASLILAAFPITSQFRSIDNHRRDVQTGEYFKKLAEMRKLNELPEAEVAEPLDPDEPPDAVEFAGSKDYPLWYQFGLRAADPKRSLYPTNPDKPFPFLYPPFAAVLLIVPSMFGAKGCVVILTLVNIASWAACAWLCVRITSGDKPAHPAVKILPWLMWVLFVYDMFFVGQPNLFLLALMLGGLECLRLSEKKQSKSAYRCVGCVWVWFAAAAKAFPVSVLAYLVWRSYWTATASMVAFMGIFLFLVPAPIRGFEKNIVELKRWSDGMLPRSDGEKIAQRGKQAKGWKNQSVLAVGHRLLRSIDIDGDALPIGFTPEGERVYPKPVYVNLVELPASYAAVVIGIAALLIGVVFMAAMPERSRRTSDSNAAEWGTLVALMVIASPIAYPYYFVWLMFPGAVMIHHIATDVIPRERRINLAIFGLVLVLIGAHAFWMDVPHYAGGVGNFLWSAIVMAIGCGRIMVKSARQ